MKKFNLIFLKEEMLLSTKEYNSWREIQDEYENYTASLDFDSLDQIKEYIIMDYKLESSLVEAFMDKFSESKEIKISLSSIITTH